LLGAVSIPGVWAEVCDFVRSVGIGLAGWFACDFQMTAQWVVPAVLKPPAKLRNIVHSLLF